MSKRTKKLTIKEYPIIYDRNAALLKIVQKEAELLYPRETTPLPKYVAPKVGKSTGMLNFIKSNVMVFRP